MSLQLEIYDNTPKKNRCPHLKRTGKEIWCSSGYKEGEISGARKIACETLSLQLWCLDPNRREQCIFYQHPEEFHDQGPVLNEPLILEENENNSKL